MLVKMKKTTPVSTTGLNNLTWEKGKIYDAPVDLAKNLVKGELAVIKKGEVIPETDPDTDDATDTDNTDDAGDTDETGETDADPDDDVDADLDLDPNNDGIIEIDE